MITPLDIQNKEFSKGVRGYKEEEVDGFLDLVTLDFDKLIKENKQLKDRVNELNREFERMRSSEGTVYATLEKAKELMGDMSAGAEKRAAIILKNAELDARRICKEAKDSVDQLTNEAETMKHRLNLFKERYKSLLEQEMDKFESMDLDRLMEDVEPLENDPAATKARTK